MALVGQIRLFARRIQLLWLVVLLALVQTCIQTGAAFGQPASGNVAQHSAPLTAQIPGAQSPDAQPATSPRPLDATLFPKPLQEDIKKQSAEIERLTKSVERVQNNDKELFALRPQIEAIISATEVAENNLKRLLHAVERQTTALGDKPKDAPAPETTEIRAERAGLLQVRSGLLGAVQQSGLTRIRAKQLLARIQSLRLKNLGRDLRQYDGSPTSAIYWQQLVADLPRLGQQIVTVSENWWAVARTRIHWLFLILIGALFLWWSLRSAADRQIRTWIQEPIEEAPPAYLKRVWMALRTLPLLLGPGLITIGLGYVALAGTGLLNNQTDSLALAALKALALYLGTNALAKAILLPWDPSWRLIGLSTRVAGRYLWLTRTLAGVYCLDFWLNDAFAALQVADTIRIAETLFANLAFAALLFLFAWLPTGAGGRDVGPQRISAHLLHRTIYWLRVPGSLAVIVIVAASLLGYLAFGRFVAGQVMLVGISAATLLLGHLAARSIAKQEEVLTPEIDGALDRHLALGGPRRRLVLGALSFLLNALLAIAALSLLLLSWGFSGGELLGWSKSLLFGFEIRNFRFSLIQILLAIALFVGVILLTRLFQAWLSRKVLASERIDSGIANSIHSGIGYLGVALAALIGVNYAGLDLSNIALIASALSIGIGFGLNAIASNFVSGLIMLVERPIKVGDWVVVGAHQGFVRRISVRATEIETFDRASVIIPNSDFMTSAVQNWTHRNTMGRVIVNIGVSYQSDPNEVMALLQEVAANCDALLKYPAPSVVFEEFGASSLDFSVRGYIASVSSMLSAKTALRLGIMQAFRDANIEIPFPQQDVHLRDLDGVREMVGHALAKRAEEARAKAAMAPGNDNSGDKPENG
ncbi:MAG: potassium efflux system protein [Hyphomicrobiaceae bacterium]|jgi:potassium efflux system protein